jgi:aminoglycoside 6'-N-acetyltransferase I
MIRVATVKDVEEWAKLRHALWPSSTIEEHCGELLTMLLGAADDMVAFLAIDDDARIRGFAEAALRRDYVNGCETSPVAFLEGIYVRPHARGGGVGRELSSTVEAWGREKGCAELASDVLLENASSQRFHYAIGFEETERVVYFRKRL